MDRETVREISDSTLVEELCEIESGLTSWEMDFIDSIAEWVESGKELTEAQRDKAEQILGDKG